MSTSEPMYLIWSNDAGAWWGPDGHGYGGTDIWRAARCTRDEAIAFCGERSWTSGPCELPPNVMIPAPENGQATFNVEQIRDMPRVVPALVAQATRNAMQERDSERQACSWCQSGGEPPTTCTCGFRCGYGGCGSTGAPGYAVFERLTAKAATER
jgi:hypothetical protein